MRIYDFQYLISCVYQYSYISEMTTQVSEKLTPVHVDLHGRARSIYGNSECRISKAVWTAKNGWEYEVLVPTTDGDGFDTYGFTRSSVHAELKQAEQALLAQHSDFLEDKVDLVEAFGQEAVSLSSIHILKKKGVRSYKIKVLVALENGTTWTVPLPERKARPADLMEGDNSSHYVSEKFTRALDDFALEVLVARDKNHSYYGTTADSPITRSQLGEEE